MNPMRFLLVVLLFVAAFPCVLVAQAPACAAKPGSKSSTIGAATLDNPNAPSVAARPQNGGMTLGTSTINEVQGNSQTQEKAGTAPANSLPAGSDGEGGRKESFTKTPFKSQPTANQMYIQSHPDEFLVRPDGMVEVRTHTNSPAKQSMDQPTDGKSSPDNK